MTERAAYCCARLRLPVVVTDEVNGYRLHCIRIDEIVWKMGERESEKRVLFGCLAHGDRHEIYRATADKLKIHVGYVIQFGMRAQLEEFYGEFPEEREGTE